MKRPDVRITRFDPPRQIPGVGLVVGTISRAGVGMEQYTDPAEFERAAAYWEPTCRGYQPPEDEDA
jgi:hypothetical protein